MSAISLTQAQQEAIRTTGESVIVTAAAGSGKTLVIAERCAHLVCDAPPDQRCDVDQLLVLTFTEAAAGEMRGRIVEALRERAAARPGDRRLREQVALVHAAQISTIHAFCYWMVRRWFSELAIDPASTVLDEHETRLLKREVLAAVFASLYTRPDADADASPLGSPEAGFFAPGEGDAASLVPAGECSLSERFVQLVNDYGLGEDNDIAEFVLRLYDFTASLPDPEEWLTKAIDTPARRPEVVVLDLCNELRRELRRQRAHVGGLIEQLEADPDEVARDAAAAILPPLEAYAAQLSNWHSILDDGFSTLQPEALQPEALQPEASPREPASDAPSDLMERYDRVRGEIEAYSFVRMASKSKKNQDPREVAAREVAKEKLRTIREKLFGKRLKDRFGHFTTAEWLAGLRQTAPYVHTLVDLVRAFRDAYAARKRAQSALDFSDLERFAYYLLRAEDGTDQPSEAARGLQRRFAHVLVDEFQDINPLQQAILQLVSHEGDPQRPGNLFVVGDVKQSIYRFRLAEPDLFVRRLMRFRARDGGRAITLQHNFRSRPEILDAVNCVFQALMIGDDVEVRYDEEAMLRSGLSFDEETPPPTSAPKGSSQAQDRTSASPAGRSIPHRPVVEVHLLEKHRPTTTTETEDDDESSDDEASSPDDDDSTEPGLPRQEDPARWETMEREAWWIARQIRTWRDTGEPIIDGRAPHFRDIAILLRAPGGSVERMAAMLAAMEIPTFAEVSGSLLAAVEVRDVLSGLRVLDNARQDIPLAAVLRSGLFGESLSADELLAVRLVDRKAAFHDCVRRYPSEGDDAALAARLERLWQRIDRYRQDVRTQPLADVLWRLYDEEGYLALVGGMRNGVQRQANLLHLHELARRFGTFRRQGLHRFLRFLDLVDKEDKEIGAAPAIGEADDVVRIMSIHRAKGLEFPVVFVAGLGKQFNLGDRKGRMIFERRKRIGLKAVDPQRLIEYPTAGHVRVAREVESATRAEEMRILYVAMTRARRRLILVGSADGNELTAWKDAADKAPGAAKVPAPDTPADANGNCAIVDEFTVVAARSPLDWLLPVFRGLRHRVIVGEASVPNADTVFRLCVHAREEIAEWSIDAGSDALNRRTRQAVAQGLPLPAEEPLAPVDAEVAAVLGRLDYLYPRRAVTAQRATQSAGAFKGTFDFTQDEDQVAAFAPRTDGFAVPPSKYAPAGTADDPIRRGILTHRVLQHWDFAAASGAADVSAEFERLLARGIVTPDERRLVDEESVAWFLSTPLAQALREAGTDYRREVPFITRESPAWFDQTITAAEDDFVLVRGIVDGILPVAEGVELLDYKTDAVPAGAAAMRAEFYRPQMTIYARAVSRLWKCPVRAAHMVFLKARRIITLDLHGETLTDHHATG